MCQKRGSLPAEGLVEEDVLGRGGDPLLGADDVGDLHEVVVDDVGEVVGGEAVGLQQDLIVDVGVLEGDVAAELVAESGGGSAIAFVRRDGRGGRRRACWPRRWRRSARL